MAAILEQTPKFNHEGESITWDLDPGEGYRIRILSVSWKSTSTDCDVQITTDPDTPNPGDDGPIAFDVFDTAVANTWYFVEFFRDGVPFPGEKIVRVRLTAGTNGLILRWAKESL